MARLRLPNQKKYYQALKGRINQYSYLVQQVYDKLALECSVLAMSVDYDGENEFHWSDFPETIEAVERLRAQYVSDVRTIIYRGTSEEWKNSNLAQDLVARRALAHYDAEVNAERQRVYFQTNSDALKAFQRRKTNGLNLSQILWNQSDESMKGLERAISTAIEKGTSAVTLSKRVSQYLNDFPSLRHDYEERYGHAIDCHDCEYRSIRLARTEINMAYRNAEQLRWQQFDFVVGYEIHLSGAHAVEDICDSLAGRYPKDFSFSGWHPNCYCYCTPILKKEEEFWNDEEHSENEVDEVPGNFKEWVEDNKKKIDKSKSVPYFVRDNKKIVSDIIG